VQQAEFLASKQKSLQSCIDSYEGDVKSLLQQLKQNQSRIDEIRNMGGNKAKNGSIVLNKEDLECIENVR